MATHKISDVFRTAGQPTITYVKRDSGKFEKQLRGYLEEGGQLCLITGPSKTGKTTLYKEVLSAMDSVPLVVQCTAERTCDDIWRIALEGVNFERVTERSRGDVGTFSAEAEINTALGWKWLAGITGVLKGSYSNASSEGEVRERILSNPSPDLLIPVLNKTNYVLVIEDFHYLKDGQKVLLFQQWKRFVDSEISIIVLGTSHRAVDIANSNKDLIGRISQIDVGNWLDADLRKICESGFKYVGAEVSTGLISKVCSEAVGLPIIVQQICLQMFNIRSIFTVSESKKIKPKLSNQLIIQ